jgi:NADH-quinone oxidoreductase subunit A
VVAASSVAIWPALVYALLVAVTVTLILLLGWILGQRHKEPDTGELYESGLRPAGPLPRRLSVEFYQLAIFFVVFDLEAVFIFAWAVQARQLGWTGYIEMAVFVVLLLAGLAYLWRTGSLDWGPAGRRRRELRERRK